MIYSKTSSYAIRALAFLASQPQGERLDIDAVAKACHVSAAYLSKIFQVLSRAGFISAQRGPGGGYEFKKDPALITLLDVIQTTDNEKDSPLSNCLMGLDFCSDKSPCLIHREWSVMRESVKNKLAASTIAQLSPRISSWQIPYRKRRILSKKVKAVFS